MASQVYEREKQRVKLQNTQKPVQAVVPPPRGKVRDNFKVGVVDFTKPVV